MPFAVTLDQNDITWLAFAAGIAAGSGNTAAHASLVGILSRVQDVPDTISLTIDGSEVSQALAESDPTDVEPWEPVDTDARFTPPPVQTPSRPQTEFGPGPIQGGLR